MQQDLIKDKSSQFNKRVRPDIARLNAVRTTKIKPIKQKIQNALAQQDSTNMDALKKDIVDTYNPKATIKSIEKDKKILEDYNKKTLSKKKNKTAADITKGKIIESALTYTTKWIGYLKNTDTLITRLQSKVNNTLETSQKVIEETQQLAEKVNDAYEQVLEIHEEAKQEAEKQGAPLHLLHLLRLLQLKLCPPPIKI